MLPYAAKSPMPPQRREFNIRRLTNPDLVEYFQAIEARMSELARSVIDGYGLVAGLKGIDNKIANSIEFNASAAAPDDTAQISINASVPIVLRALFDFVLSNDDLLPGLNGDPQEAYDFHTQLFVDVSEPTKLTSPRIVLSKEKSRVSVALSDLCVTFMITHEYGHLLCGHAGALAANFADEVCVEFGDRDKNLSGDYGLRQYWEYQADCIGASLLAQYATDFIQNPNPAADSIKAVLTADGLSQREIDTHLAAMVIASLHVLFLYSDGCKFDSGQFSFHPPAQARIMYVKDIVATEIADRCGLSADAIGETYHQHYLSRFVGMLDEIGLKAIEGFKDDYLDEIYEISNNLKQSHSKYRTYCKPWSWLPVEDWDAPD